MNRGRPFDDHSIPTIYSAVKSNCSSISLEENVTNKNHEHVPAGIGSSIRD